jgi:hypothetical protein
MIPSPLKAKPGSVKQHLPNFSEAYQYHFIFTMGAEGLAEELHTNWLTSLLGLLPGQNVCLKKSPLLCSVETVLQSPSVTLDVNSTSSLLDLLALYLKKEKGLFSEDLHEREKLSRSVK